MVSVSGADVGPRNRVKYLLKVVFADSRNRLLNFLDFFGEFNRFRLSNAKLRVFNFHEGHCLVHLIGARVGII